VAKSIGPLLLALAGSLVVFACSDPLGPTEPSGRPGGPPQELSIQAVQALDPDDARVRDFERWRPNFFNRRNWYTWPRARDDFNGHRLLFWAIGLSFLEQRARVVGDAAAGRVLRIKYPAHRYGARSSGASFPWIFRRGYEELQLEYRVKFEGGFRFTTSGKLPGLCGATDRIGCYRYTGGNKPNGDDGFSVRVVWLNGDGLMGTYVYHADQAGKYGDIFVWRHANGDPVRITRGDWHAIRLRVKMNDPGVANGEAEAWMDDERVALATGLRFRDDSRAGRAIKINEMYFNTFHGGDKPSDAPPQTQYSYFDEFRLRLPPQHAVVAELER